MATSSILYADRRSRKLKELQSGVIEVEVIVAKGG